MDVHDGDKIEIPSNKVDQPPRQGVVERVVRREPLTIEVRWDDRNVTSIQPSGGTLRVLEGPEG